MQDESTKKKLCMAAGHGIYLLVALILGAVFLSHAVNANNINSAFVDYCDRDSKCKFGDVNFYDVAFEHGPFSHVK